MHKKRLNDFKLERMRRMQAVDQVIFRVPLFCISFVNYSYLRVAELTCLDCYCSLTSCTSRNPSTQIQQKADRDEKESAEKAKQEEAARREADRAKREYQAQLAQEVGLSSCCGVFCRDFQLFLLFNQGFCP